MKTLKTKIALLCLFAFAGDLYSQNILDGVYIKENSPARKYVPYAPLREADVMYSKRIWRTIDLREKVNHVLYYPTVPINDRKSMFDVIKTSLLAGKLTAYNNPVLDDEFKVPMTKSELENLFTKVDTNYVENINTGLTEPAIVRTEMGAEDVKQYWIKEDWFFDRQRSVMDVRIIGIAPLIESKTETGEVRGCKPIFWIYFPEARSVFANAEVYNRQNDAERRTLEDIFWKRQFGSYIHKESNVYDRVIVEYKTGLDALLEAERVKEDLFTFEHDLWHF